MAQHKKYKTAKKAFHSAVLSVFKLPVCCLLVLSLLAGCSSQPDTAKTIDFSHHSDGSRITEDELSSYQESVLDTLLITENNGTLTGTHTGLFSTVVSVTLYDTADKSLLKDCFALLAEYETVLSRTMPGSELYALNKNTSGSAELSPALSEVLGLGLSYREASKGRFDLTVAPLSDLWAFGSDDASLPSDASVSDALEHVNGALVTLENNRLTYPAGTQFDLGAVAKGWLSDQVAEFLRENGVERAMINLGGNTLAIGEKADGSAYRVGVTMPFSSSSELAGIVSVKNKSVVTSGIYERYFVENGTLYHHLLDATTGFPAENDLLSVTIVCENSALADTLSTVCFLLGTEDGLALIEELNTRRSVYAMFLTGEYDIEANEVKNLMYHFSEGFEEGTGFERECK